MDYESSIQSAGVSGAAVATLVWQQMWMPLIALVLIVVAAIAIRFFFRRHKKATDV